jgi:hypothetical protein
MTRLMISTAVLAMAISSVGCFRLPDAPSFSGRGGGGGGVVSDTLRVSNGSQAGSMGNIRNFTGAATQLSGSYSSSYSNLRLDSEGSFGWVMSSINVTGDLASAAFAPGTHRTYINGLATTGTEDGTSVSVIGCSGPEFGNYTFDGPPAETEITIEQLAGNNRRMNYTLTFDDGAVTTGSVVYQINPSGI